MNRAQYLAAYREARKQARFILTFSERLERLDPMQRSFPRQLPRFDFSRLSGDPLRWIGEGYFQRDKRCHASLLNVLRHDRANYPARLPA